MKHLEDFFRSATAFCEWAECDQAPSDEDGEVAIKLLSQLCFQVLNLPALCDEEDAPDIPHDEWALVYKRFGTLPFNYYALCAEPFNDVDPSPCGSHLADDLADIWRDLKGGIALYQKGNQAAAAWEWRETFRIHWGRYATSALYALHCWRS